ncbi:MAG: Bax inhibitor-1/YccA family protein [Atopobiaceae bacterium]|jgi:uncharacterized YccA/Bax inhibitor family protein|nr:Bax inhibitor-1/YccA family protein [Atopobiaceae bacterium]
MAQTGSVASFVGYGMCNPLIRKMAKKANTLEVTGDVATYQGIAHKTIYFLVLCLAGYFVFGIAHSYLMANAAAYGGTISVTDLDNLTGIVAIDSCAIELMVVAVAGVIVLFTPLLAWLIRPAIPVVGTLYALFEGYFIGMFTQSLTPEYKWVSLAAFILTAALVGGMLFLYVHMKVRLSGKAKTIVFALFLTCIFGGIALFALSFIPGLGTIIQSMMTFMGSPIVSIAMSVVFVIIAALFLLVDFDTIQGCVEGEMPKKLEWMAAFGLVYTVIYIYFKIINIILQILGQSRRTA